MLGVGETLRHLDSTSNSDGVSWIVLTLCTVSSGFLWSDRCLKNDDLVGDGGLCLTILEVCAFFFNVLPSLKFGERMEMGGPNEPSYINKLNTLG